MSASCINNTASIDPKQETPSSADVRVFVNIDDRVCSGFGDGEESDPVASIETDLNG